MVKNLKIFNDTPIEKAVIHKIIKLISNELEFTISNLEISFIRSDEMKLINKKYLSHDYSTDIVTFDYSNEKSFIDGEIIISNDDAKINSKRFKSNLKAEILRLIIHGLLHLLGYNDQKMSDRRNMKSKENYLVKKYISFIRKN